MSKRKSPSSPIAAEPQAGYASAHAPMHISLGVEDAVGGFLRPIIMRKHSTRGRSPSWATVADVIRTYTERNDLILGFIGSLNDEELRALFDTANRHLKDWEGIERELGDPAVRRSVLAHKESVRRIKLEARRALEQDMREAISRSASDRMIHSL